MQACRKRKPRNMDLAPAGRSPFLEFVRKCYEAAPIKRDGYLHTERQYRRAMASDAVGKWHWYDELVAQRGLSLALARRGEFDLARRYFDLMPYPALLVFVLAPPEVIIERNRRRHWLKGQDDRSDSAEYLSEVTQVALYRAKLWGKVLVLDATQPAHENAVRVLEAVG